MRLCGSSTAVRVIGAPVPLFLWDAHPIALSDITCAVPHPFRRISDGLIRRCGHDQSRTYITDSHGVLLVSVTVTIVLQGWCLAEDVDHAMAVREARPSPCDTNKETEQAHAKNPSRPQEDFPPNDAGVRCDTGRRCDRCGLEPTCCRNRAGAAQSLALRLAAARSCVYRRGVHAIRL